MLEHSRRESSELLSGRDHPRAKRERANSWSRTACFSPVVAFTATLPDDPTLYVAFESHHVVA